MNALFIIKKCFKEYICHSENKALSFENEAQGAGRLTDISVILAKFMSCVSVAPFDSKTVRSSQSLLKRRLSELPSEVNPSFSE